MEKRKRWKKRSKEKSEKKQMKIIGNEKKKKTSNV